MCLSNVYRKNAEGEELLFSNVATVSQKDDKLVFSNILGVQNEIRGVIKSVDLLENIIYIETPE